VAAALVVVTGDDGSAAWKLRPEANKAATVSQVALEPAENESNPIDETMLDNGRDACKENVVRARGKRETVEKVVRGLRVRVAGRKHLRLVLRTPFLLKIHDLLDLHQKSAVDLCQFENQPDGEAGSPCAVFIFGRGAIVAGSQWPPGRHLFPSEMSRNRNVKLEIALCSRSIPRKRRTWFIKNKSCWKPGATARCTT